MKYVSPLSVEHELCVIKSFFKNSGDDKITELFTHIVPYYSHISSIIDLIVAFVWNYLDIFIMMISIGLSSLFELLNKELEQRRREVDL